MAGGRRPYPVRWWYAGYRDGYHQLTRERCYFSGCEQAELLAYEQGRVRGKEESKRQDRHLRLIEAVPADI